MNIDDNDVVKQLTLLGLNQREAKVYLALLRIPEASAAELGRVSEFPRTKIYEVIAQMVTKGICSERQEGSKKYYRATRPSELADQLQLNWKKEREAWAEKRNAKAIANRSKWEMDQRVKWEKKLENWEKEGTEWEKKHDDRLANASEVFDSLEDFFSSANGTASSLEKVETLHSKEQIHLKFEKFVRETEFEMLGFSRSPYAASDESVRAEQVKSQSEIMARGITNKAIYMDEPEEREWLPDFVRALQDAGEQTRIAEDLPMKMFIFDRKTVMIPLPTVPGLKGGDFTMMVVRDEGFVLGCCMLFESIWEKGTSVDDWLERNVLSTE